MCSKSSSKDLCAGNCSYVFWEGVTVFITLAFVNGNLLTYTIEQ